MKNINQTPNTKNNQNKWINYSQEDNKKLTKLNKTLMINKNYNNYLQVLPLLLVKPIDKEMN